MKGQIHAFKVFDKNLVLDVNSGSVLEVDDIAYDILKQGESLGNSAQEEIEKKLESKYPKLSILEAMAEIETMKDKGYIFTELDSVPIIDKLQKRNYVKALCLNVAHDCNLRCKYCFASKGDYHGKRELMSIEVGKKAVDFLVKRSGKVTNLEIDFFGGEPLMALDTVKAVISYAKSVEKRSNKKFHFTITTNALLLNDSIINYLHENMDNIVLSLDGRKEINDFFRVRADGSGSYDKVIENIKKVVKLRKRDKKEYYVRGTFTRYNLDFAKDVFHMANLGFEEVSIEPVVSKNGNYLIEEEHLYELFDQYGQIAKEYIKRQKSNKNPFKFYHFNIDIYNSPCIYKRLWACGAGRDYLAVTPSGDVYPCHQFVGQNDFLMGNVSEMNLNSDVIENMHKTNVFSKESCRTCWARFFCSGGCNANNYIINGDINKPYSITCELQKKRIEYAIYLNTYINVSKN